KVTPPGVVTTDDVADTVDVTLPSWVPGGIAGWLLDLLRRWRALPWLVLTLAVVLVIAGALLWVAGGAGSVAGAGIVLVGLLLVALWQALRRSESALDRADSVRPGGLTEEHVD